jgi:serine protease SohB
VKNMDWMGLFTEYGVFLAKTLTLVVALLFVVMNMIGMARARKHEEGCIVVDSLNDEFQTTK